jgi:two-component system NtrC family sensor kinase
LPPTRGPSSEAESAARPASGIVDEAQRALVQRPWRSARVAIAGSFAITFLLLFAVTIVGMVTVSGLKSRVRLLEDAGDLDVALLEARRYEKNYLFSGTRDPVEARAQLDEALEYLRQARSIVERINRQGHDTAAAAAWREVLDRLQVYGDQLTGFVADAEAGREPSFAQVQQVREAGRQVQQDAAIVLARERDALERQLDRTLLLAGLFLLASLVIVTALATAVSQRIIRPINRFVSYTRRIAAGDFSPIMPTRRYRDEFSNLAVALNVMLHELAEHQEQLTRAGKLAALGSLTSGIAHELNNPLNNISLTTESLLDNLERYSPAEQRALLEDIFTQVERASSTVRNLLDFTRQEQPVFVSTLLPDILESAARLVRNEAALNQVEVVIETAEDLPPIRACARNLEQVFLNLFLNAIQAMPRGGNLRVHAHRQGADMVRVDVADTGTGIAPADLQRIFDPFYTTKDVGEGTGLGLTVVLRLVENHGGRIEVDSRPGEGTVFSVFLLVKGPAASSPQAGAVVPVTAAGEKTIAGDAAADQDSHPAEETT